MKPVTVKIPRGRSYPIYIGNDALDRVGPLSKRLKATRSFIIADRKLAMAAKRLEKKLSFVGITSETLLITANEQAKDYQKMFSVYSRLIKHGMDRHSVLYAVGGGVIGDLAGFIASTYLRGIRWVGIPTTLLAQVDSSIGGKTGVNHPLGKNLIGSFHHPSFVLCDTNLLQSLPPRDRVSGFGEMLKYGLAFDSHYFRRLLADQQKVLDLDPKVIVSAIRRSVEWKAKIVSRDEWETKGIRITLNLGHTLGHAYEAATQYQTFRHGEAVILGLKGATHLSQIRGHLSDRQADHILSSLAQLPIPKFPNLTPKRLLEFTKHDKKAIKGNIQFVLLQRIGKTVIDRKVSSADIISAIQRIEGGNS